MKKFLVLALFLASGAANAVQFNMVVLDSLGGDSGAYGMNESGQIVGNAYNSATGVTEAVVWNSGVVMSLGVEGIARAVNNSGTVVGENGNNATKNNTGDGRAYKWDSINGYQDLGDLNGSYAGAWGINESGVITGNSYTNYSDFGLLQMHAFRWDAGTMSDLAPPNSTAGYSRGMAINDSGTVVGRASLDTFTNSDKFMAQWDASDTFTHFTGPYNYSSGRDINNAGVSVGLSKDINGDDRASIWSASGSITVFDTFGGDRSLFNAINEAGIAVGFAKDAGDIKRAMITLDGTTLVDLNTLVNLSGTGFLTLNEATDINEFGEIVGIGTRSDGSVGAFALTAVPVPGAVWLFASGLGMIGWLRRRQAV